MIKNKFGIALSSLLSAFILTGCGGGGGGGGGGGTPPTTITSFELLDPTPGAGDEFGRNVVLLPNGNIVVTDRFDSSVASNNGAVHLYNPLTQTRIASFYGDNVGDEFGRNITAVGNNNFVIVSTKDDVGGISDAGSVFLVDGSTGAQIGATLSGDVAGDSLGSSANSGVIVLGNNNFVISSRFEDVGGIVDAGTVRLMNSATGAQIGTTLAGDGAGDLLGLRGITALGNNNFVISSSNDSEGGVSGSGSVRLVNGSTGVQIGATLAGDMINDGLGGSRPVTALSNNNFVIISAGDDEGGVVDAGSVRLVDGNTGVQIGATLAGDVAGDLFGSARVTALGNNNFVIAASNDDEGGIVDAGSVRLVNGSTGVQIGTTIAGDVASDALSSFGITVLSNNNFVIASPNDDEGGIVDAGSARLVDGSTGAQIGATIAGDNTSDSLGSGDVVSLGNNNFVISSGSDTEGGIDNVGSIRLVDGSTGAQVGVTLIGNNTNDFLGSEGVTALATNNFVVATRGDDEGGVIDAGSVRLVDGSTNVQMGASITGSISSDFDPVTITPSATGLYYILAAPEADNGGIVDSGLVRLIAP